MHFESRKHILRYDDVVNQQRKIIYEQRKQVLDGVTVKDRILEMTEELISSAVTGFCSGEDQTEWNFKGLREHFKEYGLIEEDDFVFETDEEKHNQDAENISGLLISRATDKYNANENAYIEYISQPVFLEVEEILEEDTGEYKKGDKIIRESAPRFPYIEQIIVNCVSRFCFDENPQKWNLRGLKETLANYGLIDTDGEEREEGEEKEESGENDLIFTSVEIMIGTFIKKAGENIDIRRKIASEQIREHERSILLENVDKNWMDHIDVMSDLKESIGLRAYAQRDPIIDFRMEGAQMFDDIIQNIKSATVRQVLTRPVPRRTIERRRIARANSATVGMTGSRAVKAVRKKQPLIKKEKTGRNEPCPCGSRKSDGSPKKYKNCCGANSAG